MSNDNNFFRIKFGDLEAEARGVFAIIVVVTVAMVVATAAVVTKAYGFW